MPSRRRANDALSGAILLWQYGPTGPGKHPSRSNEEGAADISDLEKWLLEQLDGPLREWFLAYTDAWSELNARCDLDSFVCSFRMGARLTLDTFMTEEE